MDYTVYHGTPFPTFTPKTQGSLFLSRSKVTLHETKGSRGTVVGTEDPRQTGRRSDVSK